MTSEGLQYSIRGSDEIHFVFSLDMVCNYALAYEIFIGEDLDTPVFLVFSVMRDL